MSLKEKLKEYLKQKLFTMKDLERVSKLSRPTIYNFKNGKSYLKSTEITIKDSMYKLLLEKKEKIETFLRLEKRLENFEDMYGEDIDSLNQEDVSE